MIVFFVEAKGWKVLMFSSVLATKRKNQKCVALLCAEHRLLVVTLLIYFLKKLNTVWWKEGRWMERMVQRERCNFLYSMSS